MAGPPKVVKTMSLTAISSRHSVTDSHRPDVTKEKRVETRLSSPLARAML
jgi:hypothetical protein